MTAAGFANAVAIEGTITAQTAPLGTQTVLSGNVFTGSIDVGLDPTNMDTYSKLLSLSITNSDVFVTRNSYLTGTTVTHDAGNVWNALLPAGGLDITGLDVNGDGSMNVSYSWGNTATNNSNAAGTFSGSFTATGIGASFVTLASAPWDLATLNVHVASDLATILSITLVTSERTAQGIATTTYTLSQSAAPEVPLPAAAWLFGSGLLGLAGAARRRRNAA